MQFAFEKANAITGPKRTEAHSKISQLFRRRKKVLLKVTPSFSCPDRRTMSKQLASKTTWQAPRFSSPLQADVLGLSSNTFHQETDLRSDPLAESKKSAKRLHLSELSSINVNCFGKRRSISTRASKCFKALGICSKKPQVEIPSKPSLVARLGVQNTP